MPCGGLSVSLRLAHQELLVFAVDEGLQDPFLFSGNWFALQVFGLD